LPTKAYSFGTTEETIGREDNRTTFSIQNIHAANYLYISDLKNMALSDGQRISPGGVFIVKKALGEEPEKAWYVVASAANTTARIFTDYSDYPQVLTYPQNTEGQPPIPLPGTGYPNGSGGAGGSASCIASAVLPFTPLLNVFRHLRTKMPGTLVRFYYGIPYPKRPFIGGFIE